MKRFDAVIFDMDGLLLDSERIALAAFVEACEHFDLGEQKDLFMRCVGTNATLGEAVLRQGLHGKADHLEFGRVWDARYAEAISSGPIPLKPGVLEFLDELREAGIPRAVATSTASARAREKLQRAGVLAKFDAIVGGDQVRESKPHPEIYMAAAAALGVKPEKCLALEDSENGVRSALGASMTVVQIPDLVEPSPELCRLGHLILRSVDDVRRYDFG